jgi:hypothetical protein
MKELIKKLLRENILTEKLANVDVDVDNLYDTFFKQDMFEVTQTGMLTYHSFKKNETDTSILTSEEAVKAHNLNPCKIIINNGSNYYYPSNNIISVSVNRQVIDYVMDWAGDIKKAYNDLDYQQQKSFAQEFTPERIKGSIHHELAHWIDDTLNNRHLSKKINRYMELGTKNVRGVPIDTTKIELQGQIHNIKQAYNKYKQKWDDFTFDDIVGLIPTLNTVQRNLNNERKSKWRKELMQRMHREGLLGKNMKTY